MLESRDNILHPLIPLVFTNFSSVSGPGLYDPKVSNKKVGNTMVYKERRMKFKASEVPGPGAYEVIYRYIPE